MILELDVGNTRLKWRCLDDSLQVDSGFLARADYDTCALCLVSLADLLRDRSLLPSVVGVRVASVASSEYAALLSDWSLGVFSVEPEFAVVSIEASGVTNGYKDAERLGVDRWLAILAAQQLSPSGFCVVDCGSAITLDVVMAGRHMGGYILPGFKIMNSGLFSETDGVKVAPDFGASSDFILGDSTETAVGCGLPMMVVGLIHETLLRAKREWNFDGQLVLTGGDAEVVLSKLDQGFVSIHKPDLVLDGLLLAQRKTLKD